MFSHQKKPELKFVSVAVFPTPGETASCERRRSSCALSGASEIDHFIQEYHQLQNHLVKMQAACDGLKQSAAASDTVKGGSSDITVQMDQLKATIVSSADVLETEVEKVLSNNSDGGGTSCAITSPRY